ncbi:MAG: hypothetical protein V4459_10140 [Pseudomonadota bacterium]
MNDIERTVTRLIAHSDGAKALSLSATVTASRDWASALFTGVRLTVELTADDGDPFEHWLAALPEAEFPMRRRFVADVEVVERREGVAVVELLVIEVG